MKKRMYLLHAHATRRNVGDDAIVLAIHSLAREVFPERDVRFCDVSRDAPVPGEPVDRTIPLYHYHHPRHWKSLLGALRRADALLIGGGELLAGGIEFLGLGLLGWSAGIPVVFSGVGVDLGRASTLNRAYTTFVARRARIFIARDDEAAAELLQLGVPADRIEVAPDLVLGLPVPELPARPDPPPPRIGVSLRPPQHPLYPVGLPELRKVASLLDRLVETRNASIVLLPLLDPSAPFAPSSPFATDREVLLRMAELMEHRDRVTLYSGSLHPHAVLEVLAGLHGLIAMRLHAAILGLQAGLAPLAIEYAPKTRRALNRLGLGHRVVRFAELDAPGTADRVLSNQVDPALIARLSREARQHFSRLREPLMQGRRGSPLLRFPLTVGALLAHWMITLYAALPSFRVFRTRRRALATAPARTRDAIATS